MTLLQLLSCGGLEVELVKGQKVDSIPSFVPCRESWANYFCINQCPICYRWRGIEVGASALLRYSLPLPVCLSIRNCYRGGEVFKLNLLHPKDYSIEINDSIDGSRFLSHHPLFIHLHCLFCPLLILPLCRPLIDVPFVYWICNCTSISQWTSSEWCHPLPEENKSTKKSSSSSCCCQSSQSSHVSSSSYYIMGLRWWHAICRDRYLCKVSQ